LASIAAFLASVSTLLASVSTFLSSTIASPSSEKLKRGCRLGAEQQKSTDGDRGKYYASWQSFHQSDPHQFAAS
jgi:hypothetical protein